MEMRILLPLLPGRSLLLYRELLLSNLCNDGSMKVHFF